MYESNGPDVKIRGNASHIAEKYLQLARDAQSSGDPIAAENYYQHAEHYFRLIAAAQEHLRQNQSSYYQQQPGQPSGANGSDDSFDDDGDDQPGMSGEPYAPAPPQQPFYPQQQPQQNNFQQPPQQQPQPQNFQPRPQQNFQQNDDDNVDRLPSFITGGQAPQQPPQQYAPQGQNSNGQASNGQNGNGNGYEGQADRFPLHRRRRRHRGPRDQAMQGDAPGDAQGDQGAAEE
jgi:hypothetical protein